MKVSDKDKLNLIKRYYKEYFRDAVKNRWLEVPEDIRHREIGYGYLKKVDNRNLSFNSEDEYLRWVLDRAPLHLYKSLAYMKYPSSVGGAQKKGIFRRELAFDIDVHGGKRCTHKDDGWLCNHCLEEGKNQVFTLIDEFLIPDFGLSKEDLRIVFSGNRGYHIYIKPRDGDIRDTIEHWSREERRCLIEYILGKNLNLNYVGSGWKRRILSAIKNKKLLAQLKRSNNWKSIIERKNEREKKRILNIIESVKNRLELDEKVMEDDIRLLRVIGSLHGYTGFIVKEVNYNSLEYFDPLRDAVYPKFNREYYNIKIKEKIDPLRIGDNLFTYKSREVPVSVILYLFGHSVNFEILE
ncbi:MAG TPA: DNA primase catalytic subunit PriS [Methanothermococcus okinawensis]|uniref:DNA primase small subunit PriS n=1 Tax=Methanofervidicoccus abyssi TaxID=2082189 RepID=A0A401HRU2_9EURY|nr:DNA primase catalytic subunit PriS [Methanofervidicoccus abyssi]GBF36910.1 DNA primase small subunit [Methanofervidicoccus abyssi]HIP16432.1 DNA primase catalytic subunit PriS [Methanothermococcus okinawensis]HIP34685.1 DNA primase catalytic subunit PriS [Methanothermococcus okinawensis]